MLLLLGLGDVDAFSTGPLQSTNPEVCWLMNVAHNTSVAQVTPAPYVITVRGGLYTPYCYVAGQPITG